MEPNKKELAAERRAKLAKLRQALSLQDRDITSAPSLTKVDEFHEEFGAADKRDGGVEVDVGHGVVDKHKIFYNEGGRNTQSTSNDNNERRIYSDTGKIKKKHI